MQPYSLYIKQRGVKYHTVPSEQKYVVSGKSLLGFLRCVSTQHMVPLLVLLQDGGERGVEQLRQCVGSNCIWQEMYLCIKEGLSMIIVKSALVSGKNRLVSLNHSDWQQREHGHNAHYLQI